jgi:hypothetical protein
MRIPRLALAFLGSSLVLVTGAHSQSAPSGKTLAATINVYVFPSNGQDASQQSKDEAECYNWAVNNVGSDPFELQKEAAATQQQTQQQVQQAQASTQGARAKGAVGGAAAGALIGEIADEDRSQAAAWGAAIGAVSARRHSQARSQQAAASAQQSGAAKQQATAEELANFKKAFSVCLESKKYMVKF